ncbi:hypothetical protein GGF32_005023 [Allomyces javanicus]|nr:hypothetical protein GGF32_005023 [Allomyces javanicus]
MAEDLVADSADAFDLVDALAALERDLTAVADKHGIILHALKAGPVVAAITRDISDLPGPDDDHGTTNDDTNEINDLDEIKPDGMDFDAPLSPPVATNDHGGVRTTETATPRPSPPTALVPPTRGALAHEPVGRLLLARESPFLVTGSPHDTVMMLDFRTELGFASNGSTFRWNAPVMDAGGVRRRDNVAVCVACRQPWERGRPRCAQWDPTVNGWADRRTFVTGVRRRNGGADGQGMGLASAPVVAADESDCEDVEVVVVSHPDAFEDDDEDGDGIDATCLRRRFRH